ncbi:tetratricopeptide repeat protein [Synechococcus sp. PCC 6717]|jgi:tetratricopeptide (TPR) repeat protein|uniref:Tfp pilus assembly protein PilF n=1 Tax=Parathermosynechococcus lividus PCC 6715 TaxID=1917166 RepID=A0A2D2Q2I8_PARLV|nr:tetratricopeptide repeat protein [Thermostichus lividus]ATS18725.1 Tfp pilus assembly protein PilF [Thermostichus lividus PCC 6715]MCH9055519.1 tetratricopeptide repeat protein [Synechococcus sp. PCC 6716]MCI3281539.1 tetratricopeptide repeat protein [Synechococcus sp. PCC 6717]
MRKKWVTLLVLILGIIPFVAISLVPLLTSAFTKPAETPTPVASPNTSDQVAELQAQEKGYQLVLEREPNNPTALEGLVMTRLQLIQLGKGSIKSVIDPLKKLAAQRPEQSEYAILLGQAQQQTGDREGAAQTYQAVLAKAPGNLNALRGLVDLYLQENRPQAALGLIEETLQGAEQANQVQPGSVDVTSVQLLLGDIYIAQKQFGEALTLFQNLSKEHPADFRPVLAQAMTLTEQGKAAEAAPLYAKAVELAPAKYKDQIQRAAQQVQRQSESAAPTESTE